MSELTNKSFLTYMYILTTSLRLEWHVYVLLVNLTKMTYLTIKCQIEHLVKLDKKMIIVVKMAFN
jgi:hypothetical protein